MKEKRKKMSIQQWQITTFAQNVVSIGGTTYNKSISQLLHDDPDFRIWDCGGGIKFLYYKGSAFPTSVTGVFSVDGNIGGVIIGGTHPTCS